ncbi:MAG: hypothetical protein DRJ38_06350 [Thermoprotei archaeon]|nr:MAG: hypothetical protein DRJ38_06350 [Thermoprotei archaeon]
MRLGIGFKIRKAVERTNRLFSPILIVLEAFLLSNAIELSPNNFIHQFIVFNQKIFWLMIFLYSGILFYNFMKVRKKRFILLYRREIF